MQCQEGEGLVPAAKRSLKSMILDGEGNLRRFGHGSEAL